MPEILVLKQPEDKIHDKITIKENKLGPTVTKLYKKLDDTYTIEIRPDNNRPPKPRHL